VSALERLEAIDARTTAATTAPWKATDPQPFMPGAQVRLYGPGWSPIAIEERTERHVSPTADAAFIIHARNDVPVMATALRAVLTLHQPVERRWAADICGGCSSDLATFAWPCETVQLIETELGQ
jgi:hypothetical protein